MESRWAGLGLGRVEWLNPTCLQGETPMRKPVFLTESQNTSEMRGGNERLQVPRKAGGGQERLPIKGSVA